MAHPQLNKPYILHTDASQYSLGAVLVQEDSEGIERPIQYISAQFSPAQRSWCVIEKEAYAVVYCLKKLRAYLLGNPVTIFVDHKPLLSLFTKAFENTKIQRWQSLIRQYNARILYRPGPSNIRGDMLSRIGPYPWQEVAILDVSDEWINLDQLQAAADPDDSLLADDLDIAEVKRLQQIEFPDEIEAASQPDSNYLFKGGLLYSISRPRHDAGLWPRLLLPSAFRSEIIDRCHSESAHSGVVKTLLRVQSHYIWPKMRKAIEDQLKLCGRCIVHQRRPLSTPRRNACCQSL